MERNWNKNSKKIAENLMPTKSLTEPALQKSVSASNLNLNKKDDKLKELENNWKPGGKLKLKEELTEIQHNQNNINVNSNITKQNNFNSNITKRSFGKNNNEIITEQPQEFKRQQYNDCNNKSVNDFINNEILRCNDNCKAGCDRMYNKISDFLFYGTILFIIEGILLIWILYLILLSLFYWTLAWVSNIFTVIFFGVFIFLLFIIFEIITVAFS